MFCSDCGVRGEYFEECEIDKTISLRVIATRQMSDGNKKIIMTADHIIPKSKQGSNDIANLQPMCEFCNNRKKCERISNECVFRYTLDSIFNELFRTYKCTKSIKKKLKTFLQPIRKVKGIPYIDYDELVAFINYMKSKYNYELSIDSIKKIPTGGKRKCPN
mgnify:CR=1 FL=1